MPLPVEIRRLMTQTVSWEALQSKDAHGDETYAPAVQLTCWVEAASMFNSGVEAIRIPDETRAVPQLDLYFDAGDARTGTFTLNDRFTVPGVGGGQPLQAKAIETIYGPPPGDTWLVKVTVR